MALNIREAYMEIPFITRAYTTACVVTTLGVVSFGLNTVTGHVIGVGWAEPYELELVYVLLCYH